MKHLLSFLLIICLSLSAISQTVVYYEDFEGSSSQITNTGTGNSLWAVSTRLQNNGFKCDSANITTFSDNPIMQTISFSTIGNSFVMLDFSHICHLEFTDGGLVEISIDNGSSWTQLSGANYYGNGNYTNNNNKFNTNSYPSIWRPIFYNITPDNSWWKNESFDISTIAANQANVLIRFSIIDFQNNGSNLHKGWYIDDIKVTASTSELNPPIINSLSTNYIGTVFNLGPFAIKAEITDQSGIDSAIVYYTVNGGPVQPLIMSVYNGDTLTANIPAVNNNDIVCFNIYARDSSSNISTLHHNSCQSFTASKGVNIPYSDNFDSISTLWTSSEVRYYSSSTSYINNSKWELGVSNNPLSYSYPNCWGTNLNNSYSYCGYIYLISPVFDFSQINKAKLKFKYYCESNLDYDGCFMEYTTDSIWHVLGMYNDSIATNWYTSYITNQIYTGPFWAGNSNTWLEAEYPLDFLNYETGPVQFRYRFVTTSSNQNKVGFYIDDFEIDTINTNYDLKAIELSPINTQTCLGNSESIEIKIKNEGRQTINFTNNPLTINISYTGNNSTTIAPFIVNSDSLLAGDTLKLTIANNIDLGINGVYIFNANINCAIDSKSENDSIINLEIVNSTIQILPHFEDFETFPFQSIIPFKGWSAEYYTSPSSSYSYPGWVVNTGRTPNWSSGPIVDHTTNNNGKYIYNKNNTSSQYDTSILVSPYIKIPNTTNDVELSYWYHMFGSSIYKLYIEVYHNGIWQNNQAYYLGQQQTTSEAPWETDKISLNNYKGSNIKVRFKAVNAYGKNYIALDDIEIKEVAPIDIELTEIFNVKQNQYSSTSDTIKIKLTNMGSQIVDFATNNTIIICSNTGINPTTFTPTILTSDTLFPGQTMTVVINNSFDMSIPGAYIFNIYHSTEQDSIFYNDTLTNIALYNTCINTFPYIEDFENISSISTGLILNPPRGWENSSTSTSSYYWGAIEGATQTRETGPNYDHTKANPSGKYFYTNASAGGYNSVTYLTSPCIDLSSLNTPNLSFWYHMYGSDIGKLYVDILHNGNWTNNVVSIIGEQHTAHNDPWKEAKIDLTPYAGSIIQIKFRAYKIYSPAGDIAIDDIKIFEAQAQDIGIIKILEPLGAAAEGTNSDIKVVVKNFGYNNINNYSLSASHNNASPITQNFNNVILPLEYDTVLISSLNLLSGNNTICVNSSLSGDINFDNDTICKNYYGLPPTYLYKNDFDNPSPPIFTVSSSKWECGAPNGYVINYAYTGDNVLMVDLDSFYLTTQVDYIEIPQIFNFTNVEGAVLSFAHWDQSTFDEDGMHIEYSDDYGNTWKTLGHLNDSLGINWYSNSYYGSKGWSGSNKGWVTSIYKLNQFDNYHLPIQFRITFISDISKEQLDGFAVDNFAINVPKDSIDIGIIEFVSPSTAISTPGSQETVTVKIKNFGVDTIYSTSLQYIDYNGQITTETWNGILYPNATVNHTFSNTYTSPNYIHKLIALTQHIDDYYMCNDSIQQNILIAAGNNDIGISNILQPYIINYTNDTIYAEVEVTNFGSNAIYNFDICFKPGNNPYVCEPYLDTIMPGQTVNFTFAQYFTIPGTTFNFCAKTDLFNDFNALNDELCDTYVLSIKQNLPNTLSIGNCMPNPVLNSAIIPIITEQYGIVKFYIYNNLGQIVYTKNYSFDAGENQIEFYTGNLASGLYSYGINYKEQTKYGRFVKN